jgi:hypothetical protein
MEVKKFFNVILYERPLTLGFSPLKIFEYMAAEKQLF